ncbi:MAG: hypothetical protein KJS97_13820 [Alphaproteobacteria bacterium]|nr:hypothetical protein [Alphaproteobacteria bacterium]
MADDDAPRRPPQKPEAPRARPPQSEKEARLAAALRANLRRRKTPSEDGES